MHVMR